MTRRDTYIKSRLETLWDKRKQVLEIEIEIAKEVGRDKQTIAEYRREILSDFKKQEQRLIRNLAKTYRLTITRIQQLTR